MIRAPIMSERKIKIVFFILPPRLTTKRFWNRSYHSHGMVSREKGLVLNCEGDGKKIPPNPLRDERRFGGSGLQLHNVDGAGAFRALLDIKADLITLGKGFKSKILALDGRMVNKHILTVLDRDKTVTFGVIKPLYCAIGHVAYLLSRKLKPQNHLD
jgi:hypothetical protein